jgi:hypothetical protein
MVLFYVVVPSRHFQLNATLCEIMCTIYTLVGVRRIAGHVVIDAIRVHPLTLPNA